MTGQRSRTGYSTPCRFGVGSPRITGSFIPRSAYAALGSRHVAQRIEVSKEAALLCTGIRTGIASAAATTHRPCSASAHAQQQQQRHGPPSHVPRRAVVLAARGSTAAAPAHVFARPRTAARSYGGDLTFIIEVRECSSRFSGGSTASGVSPAARCRQQSGSCCRTPQPVAGSRRFLILDTPAMKGV